MGFSNGAPPLVKGLIYRAINRAEQLHQDSSSCQARELGPGCGGLIDRAELATMDLL